MLITGAAEQSVGHHRVKLDASADEPFGGYPASGPDKAANPKKVVVPEPRYEWAVVQFMAVDEVSTGLCQIGKENSHGSLLGGLGMACKLSTDLNQAPRTVEPSKQSMCTEIVKRGSRICVAGSRVFQDDQVADFQ